jgi:integrase
LVPRTDRAGPTWQRSSTSTFDPPPIRLHALRHTWATLALQAGIHPKVVQERLGHANVSITLNIYSHVAPTLHDEAAETVARMLRAGSPNRLPLEAVDER